MFIKLLDGREQLFQWDLNRQIIVSDPTVDEVHFSNGTSDCSLVVGVEEVEGLRLANIPNILLQNAWPIKVYAYCGAAYTKTCHTFKVMSRSKPDDYVYTETEVKRWEDLAREIEELIDDVAETEAHRDAELAQKMAELELDEATLGEHDIRLTQLEAHISDDYFTTDTTTAYEKVVPALACPYAQINSVGGATRIEYSPNLLEDAGANGWQYGGWNTSFYASGIGKGKYRFDIINKPENCTCHIIYDYQDDHIADYTDGEVMDVNLPEGDYSYFLYINLYGLSDGDIIYPMLYRVPDDNLDFTITEYSGYGTEKIVPTPIEEIVSKGANLAVCTEDKTATNAGLTIIRESGKSFAVVNGTASADNASKLFGTFKLKAGTYTAAVYGLNATDRLYIGSGSAVVVNNIKQDEAKTFTITEEKECFLQMVFTKGSIYTNKNVEVMVNMGDTAAPYHPYTTEPIDIVAIPEAVKSLGGWGHGLRSAAANLTKQRDFYNTYDFNTKQYTKWLSEEIVIDGENIKAVNMTSTVGGFQVDLKRAKSTYADYTALKMTSFTSALTKAAYTGYLVSNGTQLLLNLFTGNGDITTIESANAWLKENQIRVVYALDKPIVTTVDIDAETPQIIEVQGGGRIVCDEANKQAIPSSITYLLKEGSI